MDGESVEEAKTRGPITLRTKGRAVTREDYEQLAREAAPEVARVRCIEAGGGADPGGVRVLVVPAVADGELGVLNIEQLIPSDESLSHIRDYLEERRTMGARVVVEPPTYMGVTVVARLRAKPGVHAGRLATAATEALNRYFHPISGGPEQGGWPFGRPVLAGEVYGVLQRLRGDRAGRGRPPVRGRCHRRPARPGDQSHRPRRQHASAVLRPPGPGRRIGRPVARSAVTTKVSSTRIRSSGCSLDCFRTTPSSSGFTDGLDDVIAPILLSLDNVDAYLDPETAPSDFVEWIAEWVGIALDENWPLHQQRALVAQAVDLFHWRGTVRGLSAHVALYAGVEPPFIESRSSGWSPPGNATLPGRPRTPNLVVRVRVADPSALDANRLHQIVSTSKPAHIPHQIEVLSLA